MDNNFFKNNSTFDSSNITDGISKETDKEFNSKIQPKSAGISIPKPLKFTIVTICFLLGLYFLVLPFLPRISILLAGSAPTIPYATKIESSIWEKANLPDESGKKIKKEIPNGRRLVIPSINVDMPIVEAADEGALAYGVWRRPNGGTINSGNMILTGHRLGYGFLPSEIMKSSSFYNLDRLQDGDFIIVYWDGEEYDYVVKGGETVLPTEVRIEDPTQDHRLTLYTCTPIGINSHRLVKYAYPVDLGETSNSTSSTESRESSTSSEVLDLENINLEGGDLQ